MVLDQTTVVDGTLPHYGSASSTLENCGIFNHKHVEVFADPGYVMDLSNSLFVGSREFESAPLPSILSEIEIRRVLSQYDELFIPSASDEPFTGDLSWINHLDVSDRKEMRGELLELVVAIHGPRVTKAWDEFYEAVNAWRATAEVLSDPELTERLMRDDDPSEMVALSRP